MLVWGTHYFVTTPGGTELDLQSLGTDKTWNSEFGINLNFWNLIFKDPLRASIQTIYSHSGTKFVKSFLAGKAQLNTYIFFLSVRLFPCLS